MHFRAVRQNIANPQTERLASIDIVRGGVMVLMALDHVRDYVTNLRFPPENLASGTAALFATRWVTHFCAPAFFLLAGIGIGIAMHRGMSAREMSRHLLVRGLWLIVLELTITSVGWRFGIDLVPFFGIVLWALGLSMIVMAGAVYLPKAVTLVLALALIATHNLFDSVRPESLGNFAWAWHVLHVPGVAIPGKLLIAYPLVPWVAVMAVGFVLAGAYAWHAADRGGFLVTIGVTATLLFVVLRAVNGYGNPAPWESQRTPALTVASFLNVLKYPPSLQFLLMTLGPVLVALAATGRARGWFADFLKVYGRVPLFFYVAHIFVAHALSVALAYWQGGVLTRITVVHRPDLVPEWYGVGLGGVYAAWAIVVLLMYWPCRWFARVKSERHDWWLKYA